MSDTPHISPWAIAFAASMATFMEVLDTTIVTVSLAHISGTLGAGQEESTWVLTSYIVANAIVLPLSGWLSDVVGRKLYFMISIVGFTAASFLCGAATSLMMLVGFRIMQGLFGGGLQPTQQAIILDAFPPAQRGMAFSMVGITMIAAPILGPTLGGWITDNYDWRWIFFMNIPVGILAFFLTGRLIHDPPSAKAKGWKNIDYIGLSLVTLAVGFLQVMLDKGQQDDWFESGFIVSCAWISGLSAVAAVVWLLRQKIPVVDLTLLKDRGFALSCLMIFVTGFSLYGGAALMPMMLQTLFGYDATMAGLVMSPGGLSLLFMMPLIGKLSGMVQARWLILIGISILSYGMYHSMFITPQMDYGHFVFMRILQVFGLPFLFIPISALAFQNVPKEKNNRASAFYALCRNLGGSVGIAVGSTYVIRHQQMRQAEMVENMSLYDPIFREYFRGHVAKIGSEQGAMAHIYRTLQEQTALLAYIDVYHLMACVVIATAVLALFLPKNNPRASVKAPDAGAH